ncbi:MAG: cobalamin-binding protein [Planctomycetota bacterium]
MATGFAVFGSRQDLDRSNPPPPTQAKRIVSMAPSLTEILFALGLDDKIVGVTVFSDYPPAALVKPKVGSFWQPNIEAVVAARPDLVVTLRIEQQRSLAERLHRIGYNSLVVDIEKVNDLFAAIETIGAATDRQPQANELVSNLKDKLETLSSMVGAEQKIRVLWVVQREPLRVAGRDTFINEMIELAGGENAIGATVHKYPPIGAEQVIACRPDVIIEPTMTHSNLDSQKETAVRYWSRFKNVPAVANGQIYVVRSDSVSRLGPRLYEGTEIIARCLRPHLFEN